MKWGRAAAQRGAKVGISMTKSRAAPLGATPDFCADSDAGVRWLTPREPSALRRGPAGSARSLGRLTATLGIGALLTVSTVQNAIGPAAAYAPADLTRPEATGSTAADAPRLTLADLVPITVTTPLGPEAPLAPATAPLQVATLAEPPLGKPVELRAAPAAPIGPELFVDGREAETETAPGAAAAPTAESRADEMLRFGGVRIPRPLVETIVRAAETVGVDPAYMMALADKESSFTPDIKASTSSAEGLFQFIERTWLEVVRDFGPKYGMEFAAASVTSVNGQLTVASESDREWILGLRRNPYLSAVMAAEMLKRDKAKIERRIGRELDRSELYLMHFLGAESAGKLIELVGAKPKQSAPKVFPAAAKANKTLFFAQAKKKVRHLTVAEVYGKLDRMIETRLDRYDGVTAFAPSQAGFTIQ